MTQPTTPTHALDWFEIPVRDLDRAQRFYEAILTRPLRREPAGPGTTLAVFPYTDGTAVGGALLQGPQAPPPSLAGSVVYLNVDPSLDAAVARATAAGASVLVPRVDLPDGMGSFVHIQDTEGNRVGLHAAR